MKKSELKKIIHECLCERTSKLKEAYEDKSKDIRTYVTKHFGADAKIVEYTDPEEDALYYIVLVKGDYDRKLAYVVLTDGKGNYWCVEDLETAVFVVDSFVENMNGGFINKQGDTAVKTSVKEYVPFIPVWE